MKYKSFHPRRNPIRYRVNPYKSGRYEIFNDSDDDNVLEGIDDVDNVEDEYEEDFFEELNDDFARQQYLAKDLKDFHSHYDTFYYS